MLSSLVLIQELSWFRDEPGFTLCEPSEIIHVSLRDGQESLCYTPMEYMCKLPPVGYYRVGFRSHFAFLLPVPLFSHRSAQKLHTCSIASNILLSLLSVLALLGVWYLGYFSSPMYNALNCISLSCVFFILSFLSTEWKLQLTNHKYPKGFLLGKLNFGALTSRWSRLCFKELFQMAMFLFWDQFCISYSHLAES